MKSIDILKAIRDANQGANDVLVISKDLADRLIGDSCPGLKIAEQLDRIHAVMPDIRFACSPAVYNTVLSSLAAIGSIALAWELDPATGQAVGHPLLTRIRNMEDVLNASIARINQEFYERGGA